MKKLLKETMNNFYVYLHKLNNGEVFYVGKGRRDRAYSKLGRSNAWKEKAKEGFDVEIYKSDLKELDSILLEKELIEKNSDGYYHVTKKGAGLKIIEKAMITYSKRYLD